ncbi:MAG: hypothetical protein ACP5U1_11200 [Desulfomonilaceae bacterium]
MKLKEPTPINPIFPVMLETAAFFFAVFFPAARTPFLAIQGLKILSALASSANQSGKRSSP